MSKYSGSAHHSDQHRFPVEVVFKTCHKFTVMAESEVIVATETKVLPDRAHAEDRSRRVSLSIPEWTKEY